ncbi:unnamed protein product [Prorocentrum cordatum]|uniref:Phospholipase B-like n=1 Tax=Prorocentrum cordatum TaxID=2364126 RepID=A0ABN9VLE2_9DINO|nr:unnamed protein product [Polarella glacialis]
MAPDANQRTKSQCVYHMGAQLRLYRSVSRSENAVSHMNAVSQVYVASIINASNLEPEMNPHNKFTIIHSSVHGSTPVEYVTGVLGGWSKDQSSPSTEWENPMRTDKWGGIGTRHQFLRDTQCFNSIFPQRSGTPLRSTCGLPTDRKTSEA